MISSPSQNKEHKMPTGTNLDGPFSSLYFSTLGTSYSFSSFQSRSSNPDSIQCYFPKTSACHTHYLWSWKPNTYLERSVPKSFSQNQACVCAEESGSHLTCVLGSICVFAVVLLWSQSCSIKLLPNVWPPWVWLEGKLVSCAGPKDVDSITPWALWNQKKCF